jgi:hypothetical protein
MPDQWRKFIIVLIYKKGDKTYCSNNSFLKKWQFKLTIMLENWFSVEKQCSGQICVGNKLSVPEIHFQIVEIYSESAMLRCMQ